jgi:cytochrome c peroxidase
MRSRWAINSSLTRLSVFLVGLLAGLASCQPETTPYQEVPPGFPAVLHPADNQPTPERIALGEKLFFDPILSVDRSISCGSCHLPEFAFADTARVSAGVEGRLGFRNTPSLINVAYQPDFMLDGGVPTLEMQVLAPIDAHFEFAFNTAELVTRLQNHPEYPALMQEAYGRTDAFALTRALAAFERTLIEGGNRHETGQLDAQETRGLVVFEAHCQSCHSGFDYTNYAFINVGLSTVYAPDSGRARITGQAEDSGKFRVPSLRNGSLTPPYMHDGSLPTLESVVDHFNDGGAGHRNQDERVFSLGLSEQERADLVAFLKLL